MNGSLLVKVEYDFCTQKIVRVVEERSVRAEVRLVRADGVHRSENVGMSSMKACKNQARRKPKVSWATMIDPGLGDPKARPKGVVDGRAG